MIGDIRAACRFPVTMVAQKGRIRRRHDRNLDRGEASCMSIIAMVVLMSACAGGGDSVHSQTIPDPGLPRRPADDIPAQQGLDNAPVEKAPRRGEPAKPSRDDDDMIINVGAPLYASFLPWKRHPE
jgi:hypothetical protein